MVHINILSEYITKQIQTKYPNTKIITTPTNIIINDIKIDIKDIYKGIKRQKLNDEGTYLFLDELILNVLGFSYKDKIDITRLYPRIYPINSIKKINAGHSIRYVNNTSIVPIYSSSSMHYVLSKKDIEMLNIPRDRLDEICKRNLSLDSDISLSITELEHGKICMMIDPSVLCSSLILLDETYVALSTILGTHFYAAIPTKNCFIACSIALKNMVQDKVSTIYKRGPYPISKDMFLMTSDGTAGTVLREI